jgi:hypothetical protein
MKISPELQSRLGLPLVLLSLLILAFTFRPLAQLDRVLEQDEIVTLRATSVGWPESMEATRGELRGDVKSLAVGLVRSMADEWTPNNQMINSWLTSFSVFVFGVSEASLRFASLGCFLTALLLLTVLVHRLSGSLPLAFLTGAMFTIHPFFIHQSLSCRGYTAATLLLLASVALLFEERLRRIDPIYLMFGLVLFCNLLFLNLVSLLFTWLAPLFLALWLAPPQRLLDERATQNPLWRWRWIWTCLFFLCMFACGIFIAAKFRDFLVTQDKYGNPITGLSSLFGKYASIWRDFFPQGFILVGISAIAAFALLLKHRQYRWFALWAVISVGLSFVYNLATKKVPYERTFIIFFPLTLVALAAIWHTFQDRRRWQNGILLVLTLAMLSTLPAAWAQSRKTDSNYVTLADQISRKLQTPAPSVRPIIVKPWVWDVDLYLPAKPEWYQPAPAANGLVDVIIMGEMQGDLPQFRALFWNRKDKEFNMGTLPASLASAKLAQDGRYFATHVRGQIKPWDHQETSPLSEQTPMLIWHSGSLTGKPDTVAKLIEQMKKEIANHEDYQLVLHYSKTGVTGFLFFNPEHPAAIPRPIVQSLLRQGSGEWYSVQPQ